MFVINPDKYLLPSYRISPFMTGSIAFNNSLPVDNSADEYFKARFKGSEYIYTISGRNAINLALSSCDLQWQDVVTILTATGNLYISKCVTNEIEKFCKWSRHIEKETKLIFVNHEFGYPYNDIHDLKKYGVPIIEDCAHSFFLSERYPGIGTTGDYVVYSFPKMFPLQIGGLLVCNNGLRLKSSFCTDELQYIKNSLSYWIKKEYEIIKKRLDNYKFLATCLEEIGLTERFDIDERIVPGVFMFKCSGILLELHDLKNYLYLHGIQCSVFYGEDSFFIPVHQGLEENDILYFAEVIKSFIKRELK
jgi:hypothetical protein